MTIFAMNFPSFAARVHREFGKSPAAAAEVYRSFYRLGTCGLEDLPPQMGRSSWVAEIRRTLLGPPATIVGEKTSGGVTKFISRLVDGLEIESVLVPMERYVTACISSQVGCRMGCRFCETGKMGLLRQLSAAEISFQVFAARHLLGQRVKNVVFMGMGEPFDNFDAVLEAVDVISDQRGLDIAERNITISTSGRIDGILRLAGLGRPHIRLAVSLNAPDDEIRSRIMPINRRNPMAELRSALLAFPVKPGYHIVVEYVLIRDLNDKIPHADRLADYLDDLPVKLNLIPCNAGPGSDFLPPSDGVVDAFRRRLVERGIFVRMRTPKGRDLLAACGQLGRGFDRPATG
ncbi:MAG: 23S rRNA (adenine(2503)-C(2))-methyltransferase RlmN [Desulfobacterales bacterium]